MGLTSFLVKVRIIGTIAILVEVRVVTYYLGTTPVMILGSTKFLMTTMVLAPKKIIVITARRP